MSFLFVPSSPLSGYDSLNNVRLLLPLYQLSVPQVTWSVERGTFTGSWVTCTRVEVREVNGGFSPLLPRCSLVLLEWVQASWLTLKTTQDWPVENGSHFKLLKMQRSWLRTLLWLPLCVCLCYIYTMEFISTCVTTAGQQGRTVRYIKLVFLMLDCNWKKGWIEKSEVLNN